MGGGGGGGYKTAYAPSEDADQPMQRLMSLRCPPYEALDSWLVWLRTD